MLKGVAQTSSGRPCSSGQNVVHESVIHQGVSKRTCKGPAQSTDPKPTEQLGDELEF